MASFEGAVIDGVKYAEGMPDPRREEWGLFAKQWIAEKNGVE